MKNIKKEACCPECGWQHDYTEHWKCLCQNEWDAIQTGGRCPQCLHDWKKIECPKEAGGCGTRSHYLDWYGDLNHWLLHELEALNASINKEKERRGSRGH